MRYFAPDKNIDVGIITVIPTEIEALFSSLNIDIAAIEEHESPLRYWKINVFSQCSARMLSVVVSFVSGNSGNTEAAITTTNFLRDWYPRLMCLIGISAGINGKVKIGDVVVPYQIHDRCMKVFSDGKYMTRGASYKRVDPLERLLKLHPLSQNEFEVSSETQLSADILASLGIAKNKGMDENEFSGNLSIIDGSLASDNVLIRDSSYFSGILDETDEKCRAGEMEAAGFVRACESEHLGFPWIIFRGISDFGDDRKDDNFQVLAAKSACIAAKLFLEKCLNIEHLPQNPRAVRATRSIDLDILGQLQRAYDLQRWEEVCRIGSVLSRPLWLSGHYEIRLKVGKMVESAAAYCDHKTTRARSMIDDLGWTSYKLDEAEAAGKWIEDGIRLAKEIKDYYSVAKGYRHLASITRRQGDVDAAQAYLNKAKRYISRIVSEQEKSELSNSILLSEGRLLLKRGQLQDSIVLLKQALDSYRSAEDKEREIKVYAILGKAEEGLDRVSKARVHYEEGRLMAMKFGRFDEVANNTSLYIETLSDEQRNDKARLVNEVYEYAQQNGLWNEARKWIDNYAQ